jgi:NAD-dependent dihydropyrimidine dehydrogenase PreA subunit
MNLTELAEVLDEDEPQETPAGVAGLDPDDAEMAAKLKEVCPVDIFADEDGKVAIVRENLDESVLCNLCVEAAPSGVVVVKKLYDGTELRRRLFSACGSVSRRRTGSIPS